MRILVTGGAGYIGSHTLVEILRAGHEAHVVDNYSNASPEALKRVRQLANRGFEATEADIRDAAALRRVVADFAPEAVIHFAGLKAVGESVADPLSYFEVNVGGTVALLGLHDDRLFKLAVALEKIALEDDYFVSKKLYPNVDFYSGIVQRALGIPTQLFTGIFALARTVGWIAQWNEMISDPEQKIGRPRQLFTGAEQRNVPPLDKR